MLPPYSLYSSISAFVSFFFEVFAPPCNEGGGVFSPSIISTLRGCRGRHNAKQHSDVYERVSVMEANDTGRTAQPPL